MVSFSEARGPGCPYVTLFWPSLVVASYSSFVIHIAPQRWVSTPSTASAASTVAQPIWRTTRPDDAMVMATLDRVMITHGMELYFGGAFVPAVALSISHTPDCPSGSNTAPFRMSMIMP